MKKLILAIAMITAVISSYGLSSASAQTAASFRNFDHDIIAIRNIAIPSFRWHYDDYLQYAPAAVMVGMKACGYERKAGALGEEC